MMSESSATNEHGECIFDFIAINWPPIPTCLPAITACYSSLLKSYFPGWLAGKQARIAGKQARKAGKQARIAGYKAKISD